MKPALGEAARSRAERLRAFSWVQHWVKWRDWEMNGGDRSCESGAGEAGDQGLKGWGCGGGDSTW